MAAHRFDADDDFGTTIDDVMRQSPLVYFALINVNKDFLLRAQTLHDSSLNWDRNGFRAVHELEQLAKDYGLTP